MSLLLDALNRASKEKQKASDAVAPPIEPTAQNLQWDAMTLLPEPVSQPDERSNIQDPPSVPHSAPVTPAASATPATPTTPSSELMLEMDLTPAAAPAPATAPAPASVALPALKLNVEPPPTPPTPPVIRPVAVDTSASAPKAVPQEQMAQDIRRAYGPQLEAGADKSRRSVIGLGVLASVLSLALGSVFLGLWGDPEKLLGLSGQSSIATVPPPVTPEQDPAASAQEPVAQQASPPSADLTPLASAVVAPPAVVTSIKAPSVGPSSKPKVTATAAAPSATASPPAPAVIPVAPIASPPSASNNEVVVRSNTTSKPAFTSKNRGPSALEAGYAALLEGRLDEAAQAYGQALRANPDERDALLGLAYINHQRGQREEAQAYYRRVLRQEPSNAVANSGLQAMDAESDPTLSASRARELASRQPDSAAAMAVAGAAFARDGLLADAALAFSRAQALEPNNPLHAYNHAVALDRLGQFAPALVQYDKVLALSNTSSTAVRAVQLEAVRLRVSQLRQALTPPLSEAK